MTTYLARRGSATAAGVNQAIRRLVPPNSALPNHHRCIEHVSRCGPRPTGPVRQAQRTPQPRRQRLDRDALIQPCRAFLARQQRGTVYGRHQTPDGVVEVQLDVCAAERQISLSFPGDYRRFLLQASDLVHWHARTPDDLRLVVASPGFLTSLKAPALPECPTIGYASVRTTQILLPRLGRSSSVPVSQRRDARLVAQHRDLVARVVTQRTPLMSRTHLATPSTCSYDGRLHSSDRELGA